MSPVSDAAAAGPTFSSVPVVDVTADNLDRLIPDIRSAVSSATFVALDCELSGLGDRKALNASSIEERFRNVSNVAKTRSVIALGVSCFRLADRAGAPAASDRYRVTTFNVVTLCQEDYIVEPAALKFLVEHGFDFQRQYSRGVPYHRGDDKPEGPPCPLRDIFWLLASCGVPVALHNGLVDLAFLYQNLYARLPRTLDSFVADLTEMFPAGVFDTKYLADYVERAQASYLQYLFRKHQRMNRSRATSGKRHLFIDLSLSGLGGLGEGDVAWRACGLRDPDDDGAEGEDEEACPSYMHHGHCPDGSGCGKSHDIDLIIRTKEGIRATIANGASPSKKRKRKADDPGSGDGGGGAFAGHHRAGFDAFMTGFVFAAHLARRDGDGGPLSGGAAEHANKVYLACKDFPLLVKRSAFAKLSEGHFKKRHMRREKAGEEEEGAPG